MKTTRLVTIICSLISAIALIGLVIWFIFFSPLAISNWGSPTNWSIGWGNIESLSGPFYQAGTKNVPQDGINSIYVDWISGTIDVKPHDGNDIVITEFAQRDLNANEKMYITVSGDTVTIRYTEQQWSGRMPTKRLEILIPRELCDNLDKLSLNSTSGLISISDLTAVIINIDATSGGLNARNIYAGTLSINGTSGTIDISESRITRLKIDITSGAKNLSGSFDDIYVNATSGSLTVNNDAIGSTIRTDITSGSQNLTGYFDDVNINCTSGQITINSKQVPSSLYIDNTSGNINIAIPNEGSITLHHDTTSGRMTSEIPITVQSSGAQFRINSTSGNLTISELR